MAFTFRNSTSAGNSTATPLTLNKPTGVVDGDVLIVIAEIEDATASWTSVGAGFTSLGTVTSSTNKLQVWWKVASSEPASWTWTQSGGFVWSSVVCVAYSGANSPSVDVFGTGNSGTSVAEASQTAPSVTTTSANDLLIFAYCNDTSTVATGMTGAANTLRTAFGNVSVGEAIIASAGATGTTGPTGVGTRTFAAVHIAFKEVAGSPQTVTLGGVTPLSRVGNQQPVNAAAALPASDISAGAWTTESGGTTNLYQSIDETTANDADYIQSPLAPNASAAEIKFASLTDPAVDYGHLIQYRYFKPIAVGDRRIDLVVRLKCGATEIANWVHRDIPKTPVDATQTLTDSQAAAITDYTNMRLVFEATQP